MSVRVQTILGFELQKEVFSFTAFLLDRWRARKPQFGKSAAGKEQFFELSKFSNENLGVLLWFLNNLFLLKVVKRRLLSLKYNCNIITL